MSGTFSPGLLASGSGSPSFVKVENAAGTVINPATEDTLLKTVGLGIPQYDYASLVQASLTDTWTLKSGGSGGSTVATVTITYTDTGKQTISTVAKT